MPRLRVFIALLFLMGVAGTSAELLLLAHTESLLQLSPFAALALPTLALGWAHLRPSPPALRVVALAMILLAVDGILGVWFHWQGNIEFEREMDPGLAGWRLFWDSAHGATPALAPGLMAQLGLLGLAYTYRHPGWRRRDINGGDS